MGTAALEIRSRTGERVRLWLMRVVGFLNLVFAATGCLYFIAVLLVRRQEIKAFSIGYLVLFVALSLVSLLLTIATARFGRSLLRGEESSISAVRKLFCAVWIFYLIFIFLAAYLLKRGGFLPVFDATRALSPQWLVGYPQLALIASIFFRRRVRS